MTRKRRPHEDIRFSAKKLSVPGVLSVLFSVFSVLAFPAAVWLSFSAGGQAGIEVGAMGMLAFLTALAGSIMGFAEARSDAVNRRVPRFGGRLGAVSALLWIVIFVIGLRA